MALKSSLTLSLTLLLVGALTTASSEEAATAPAVSAPAASSGEAAPAPARRPNHRGEGRAWWAPVADRGWLGLKLSTQDQLEQALAAERLGDEWIAIQNTKWLTEKWDGKGALILQVFPDTPAEKSGLIPGDVVTSFNGIRTSSPGELAFTAQRAVVGHDADLEILRDGDTRRVLVEVGLHPEDARRLAEEKAEKEKARAAEAPRD